MKDKERLFGQFSVIVFSKIPDGQHLSLPNFARAKPIFNLYSSHLSTNKARRNIIKIYSSIESGLAKFE